MNTIIAARILGTSSTVVAIEGDGSFLAAVVPFIGPLEVRYIDLARQVVTFPVKCSTSREEATEDAREMYREASRTARMIRDNS